MMTIKRYILFTFMLLGCLMAQAAINVKVLNAKAGNKVEEGSRFVIEITYGGVGSVSYPNPPAGTSIVYQAMEQNSINGVSSSRCALTLLAKTPGSYSFQASVAGKKSPVVKYTVVPAGSIRGGGASSQQTQQTQAPSQGDSDAPKFIGKGNENMFLRASISKTRVYEQEALVYTIKLYSSYEYIKFLGATAAPKFDGFVVEEDKVTDAQWHFETVNGRAYKSAVVTKYIIFPQRPGRLRITGNTYTVSADAFEYYHDPYFQNMQVRKPVQLNLTPNDLEVDVQPLPSPRPPEFTGGVGSFSLQANLPNQTYKTNQAATITYTIKGQGNLKYVKMPDIAALYPPSLEVFTPESEVQAGSTGSNVRGAATFTYSFMPTETGRFNIPEVKMVYFDPSSGRYETATARGFTINVEMGAASDKSQTVKRFDSKLLPVENLAFPGAPWITRFSYWLLFIVPGVLFIVVFLYYLRYRHNRADMDLFRSRKAGKLARRKLRAAYACLKHKDSEHFYDEILSALWGFMGDKLRIPSSELTRQNISEMLVSHGIGQDTVDQSIALLDDCEFAKYSPATAAHDMTAVYDRAADVISTLDNDFSHRKVVTDNSSENEIF